MALSSIACTITDGISCGVSGGISGIVSTIIDDREGEADSLDVEAIVKADDDVSAWRQRHSVWYLSQNT